LEGSGGDIAESVALHGRAMRAGFQLTCPGLGLEASAARELKLLADSDLPFARFILTRSIPGHDVSRDVASSMFPVAFAKAIQRLDDPAWNVLLNSVRSEEAKWLVRVAQVLLSPEIEEAKVLSLLGETTSAGRLGDVVRTRLKALLSAVEGKPSVVIQINERRKEITKVLGDAAATMFDARLAA
jgi:hypothetical protein